MMATAASTLGTARLSEPRGARLTGRLLFTLVMKNEQPMLATRQTMEESVVVMPIDMCHLSALGAHEELAGHFAAA